MKCCSQQSAASVELPFRRFIALNYYDGPTEGITFCESCKQPYAFKLLDWDKGQNLRIFSFAPIQPDEEQLLKKLQITPVQMITVLPPAIANDAFIISLMNQWPTHIALVEGLPGLALIWRKLQFADLAPRDWFEHLKAKRDALK